MLYLETKWTSLIPFAKVADLLRDVLPVEDSINAETVRNHLQATAERMEHELGEERQLNLFEGSEEGWAQQPLPDGPITVGLDGGYVRAAHKQGWFEVIADKSVVAFRGKIRMKYGKIRMKYPQRSVSGSYKLMTKSRASVCGSC